MKLFNPSCNQKLKFQLMLQAFHENIPMRTRVLYIVDFCMLPFVLKSSEISRKFHKLMTLRGNLSLKCACLR
ncbi:CLUMA_CG010991, isoform A [Clunio marinus]|uniref:CLUMA_CG010991, isoform A n=1 Tax=Clunio marinus TaxID=568069 RepID=A0A1J1IBE8_9DIPT|nr:CLUMA_CG010991, isoform A [Clunio marinus]